MTTQPITDRLGRIVSPGADEPPTGSVVLTEGLLGSAWQRFASDGLWHSARGGKARTWSELLERRNVVLLYTADHRRKHNRVFDYSLKAWVCMTCRVPGTNLPAAVEDCTADTDRLWED